MATFGVVIVFVSSELGKGAIAPRRLLAQVYQGATLISVRPQFSVQESLRPSLETIASEIQKCCVNITILSRLDRLKSDFKLCEQNY